MLKSNKDLNQEEIIMYDRIQIPLLSLADLSCELAKLDGAEIIDHEGRYISYCNKSMFYGKNYILKADNSEIEAIIREIRENMSKGMPASISFTKELMPENIEDVMEKNGFAPFIKQTGMIFDFDKDFDETVVPEIEEIHSNKIVEWSLVTTEAFPKPREDDTYISLVESDRILTYGFMDNGKIASTGMLCIHPEIPGIHEISTLPDYRGKGQASAIIVRMLQDLKKRGIKSVSLQASDAGKRVYEPIGFKTVSLIPTWIPAG